MRPQARTRILKGNRTAMRYLVTLTFDLKGAAPSIYPKIDAYLQAIDLGKVIITKNRPVRLGSKRILLTRTTRLPRNTFVARFDQADFDNAKAVVEYARQELSTVFKKHGVAGRFFVSVGREWAWKSGKIPTSRRPTTS